MYTFRDFKNFHDTGLDLFKPVTILIGKNGAGKTNAIEAVELLANLAHGRPLYEIVDVGRSTNGFELRGGLSGCTANGKSGFELKFEGQIPFLGRNENFGYSIQIETGKRSAIRAESLQVGARNIFSAETIGQTGVPLLSVTFDNFARGPNKPTVTSHGDRSVLSQYTALTGEYGGKHKNANFQDAAVVVRALANYMRASFVFDPRPNLMRSYERINQGPLAKDGANLSSVLFALKNGTEEEQASLARILDKIKQVPEEPFWDFGFVETAQHDVLFGFRDAQDSTLMDARVLSDGTLRSLAVLTALETVDPSSRIVIEEFDNGVHPSRVGVLTQALWECSKRRKLNVLVTTHNPASLDTLAIEQMSSVVLCYRDSADKNTKLIPLTSLPRADALLSQGHLGDLVTRRIIEKYLMPNFESEQKKVAQEWLSELTQHD